MEFYITATRQISPAIVHLTHWNFCFWRIFCLIFARQAAFLQVNSNRIFSGFIVVWFQSIFLVFSSNIRLRVTSFGRQSPKSIWFLGLDHCHFSRLGLYFQLETRNSPNFEIQSGLYYFLFITAHRSFGGNIPNGKTNFFRSITLLAYWATFGIEHKRCPILIGRKFLGKSFLRWSIQYKSSTYNCSSCHNPEPERN